MEKVAEHDPGAGRSSAPPYHAVIDRRQVDFAQPEPESRQMLSAAGCHPADDFVLIWLEKHGTRSIGLDERVDLRAPHEKAFRTFKSDRIFRFTIDGRGFEWGVAAVPEPELREIAHLSEDEVFVLKRDGKDVVLGPDDTFDLGKPDTEHLLTQKRSVRVFLDDKPEPKIIPVGVYTTEQLIKELGVPAGYLLNVVNEHGELELLKPGRHLRVHDGMKFFSQVPGGGSS
jgi:hypothetical protein